jgi:hypothetical protein
VVTNCLRWSVGRFDSRHFVVCVALVWPCWSGCLDVRCLLDREEVTKLIGWS